MDGYLNQDVASFHPGEVMINLEFTAGTSGAVPSTLTRRAGIASVVLSATGVYSVKLSDSYVSLLGVSGLIIQATYDKTHGGTFTVTSETVKSATPTIVLQVRTTDGNGTAIALTSGDVMKVSFRVTRVPGNG